MKRVEIVIYTLDDSIDEDVNRVVGEARAQLTPELVIVSKTDITEKMLARALSEADESAL